MGAVQKRATVVIVGLVGLATLVVVYIFNEPDRREAEAEEQEHVAIERGVETYIQNCMVCHGPAGEGALAGDGRVGFPLNPAAGGEDPAAAAADGQVDYRDNQTDNETIWAQREPILSNAIHNGRGLMPAWGRGSTVGAVLNDEQIEELILMIHKVDWDHVYNEAVTVEDEAGNVAYVYPTAPPPPGQAAQAQATQPPADGGQPAGGTEFTVQMVDVAFNPNQLTIPANTDVRVVLPNNGASPHNFNVDQLNVHSETANGGQTVEVTINGAPGEYEYYCSVPGHKQMGMVGTLTISDQPAPAPAAAEQPAAEGEQPPPAEPGAPAAEAPAAAQPVTVELVDIDFNPKEFTIPANTDVKVALPNKGAAPHTFDIDVLNIHSDEIPGGGSGEVTINAPPGTYEYYCRVPGHKQIGMVGTLTVE